MKVCMTLLGVMMCAVGLAFPHGNQDPNLTFQLRTQSFIRSAETSYQSVTVNKNQSDQTSLRISAVQGRQKTTTLGGNTFKTGGSDIELAISSPTDGVEGSYFVGFSFPSTNADKVVTFTYGFTRSFGDSLDLSLRGYGGSNSANAIFAKVKTTFFSGITLSAEAGSVFTGYTTLDTQTGQAKRQLLGNLMLSKQVSSTASAFVGISNTLGDSTRFSMNSSLGNTYGVTFGISGRF
jgi:hypothetical protein